MTPTPTGRVETTERGPELVLVRSYRAPVEDVWASLTEPARLARWYGTVEGELAAGSTVMVTMLAEDGAPAEPARILECEPPRRFVAALGAAETSWRVRVDLEEVAGTTTMTFVHELAEDVDPADVGPGWEFYADRLEGARRGDPVPEWGSGERWTALASHYRDTPGGD